MRPYNYDWPIKLITGDGEVAFEVMSCSYELYDDD